MIEIEKKACGFYMTNCYIVRIDDGRELIIDPGVDADEWVMERVKKPVAILNTHGHFDHIWSNAKLKSVLNIPVYAPRDDIFMIENDPFEQGTPSCKIDFEVNEDEELDIDGIKVEFLHFPGHTPGCSAIIIENSFFSGDFIFKGSIGRVDFPFSNPANMKKSIQKVLQIKKDYHVYPGHGEETTLFTEQKNLPNWLNYI